MRLAWAIAAGLLLGIGVAWWLARPEPVERQAREQRAQRAAAAQARDARPSLYRWRDEAGVLQITDKPPAHRRYERIDREPGRGIEVKGGAPE
jgi:uncharacterized protein DUF4124